jgi:hypothetical protein
MSDQPDPDCTRTAASPDTVARSIGDLSTHAYHSTDRPPDRSPLPVVPGYEVLGVLGRGGMGVVYQARQTAVNRVVALKMLPAGNDAGPTAEARFQIEAEAVAALQHPGIVQVFEFGHADGGRFLTLEYVPGGTLADRMTKRTFSPREAAELVATLADAVHAAHQKGVIHRDLKPGNVLLTEAGEPKVADFGLARIGQSELTVAGAIMGTPSYMSPEQAAGDGKKVGTPADVWALGAILYELLTGRVPFRREGVAATLHAVIHDAPTSPRLGNRKVSRDLETICLKCLQKDPADRYLTADALAADLRAYSGGFPVAARPVGLFRRALKRVRRNPVRSALLAVTLIAGVVAGACIPRYTRAQPLTVDWGVLVKEEKDAEDAFKAIDQTALVYTYTGADVDFWITVERDGQETEEIQYPLSSRHDTSLLPLKPNEKRVGKCVWVRGKRDENGDETWTLGQSHRSTTTTDRVGGTVANAFSRAKLTSEHFESFGIRHTETRTVSLGKSPRLWSNSTYDIPSPLPDDRPVCLREIQTGSTRDHMKPHTTIRVMCEVRSAMVIERRNVEREAKRKQSEK